MSKNSPEKVMEVAKRRGFIWPSFEPYGGVAGFYDFGPLGALLKEKIIQKWRHYYVVKEGCLEIDSPTVFPEEVLEASGHVNHFTDVMIECKSCTAAYEVTDLVKEFTGKDIEGQSREEMKKVIENSKIRCPECGGNLGKIYDFNTMFPTEIGPKGVRQAYLRPETAQSIFVDFNRLQRIARRKLPFGVAQTGKGYRNEISPRKGIIRLREFTMAEAEIFFDPEDPSHPDFDQVKEENIKLWLAEDQENEVEKLTEVKAGEAVERGLVVNELLAYHLALAKKFVLDLGIKEEKMRFREQVSGERAHYSEETWDLEVYSQKYDWVEVAGIAYRTDYDLSRHSEYSDSDMTVFYQEKGEEEGKRVLPHVVEPSFGVDRPLYCVLEQSFVEEDDRSYLQLNKELSPIEVSVFPLISDDDLTERAVEVHEELKGEGIFAEYDDSGSIGRRYARADEVGTPYCVTIDHQTLEDSTVTIRDRDSTEQIRVKINELSEIIDRLLDGKLEFESAGEPV
ncbi:hypothetical protein AKJ57_05070 [candidate division MSBL1 archaeon SCGC-AAA259A05]|uniref:glycine--tRNA ligase n=1 Tax=candidate division MSBL1 archaeon SCGC-AAA259A05 TaxID=1698259 RepID=A0A133U603_9EURY|nr:hypothetical protein AKJ57_05070 [candidate division MSBL1 archaeon SCGC-AAA259A05]